MVAIHLMPSLPMLDLTFLGQYMSFTATKYLEDIFIVSYFTTVGTNMLPEIKKLKVTCLFGAAF
jgi:hypothetical protein